MLDVNKPKVQSHQQPSRTGTPEPAANPAAPPARTSADERSSDRVQETPPVIVESAASSAAPGVGGGIASLLPKTEKAGLAALPPLSSVDGTAISKPVVNVMNALGDRILASLGPQLGAEGRSVAFNMPCMVQAFAQLAAGATPERRREELSFPRL